MSYSVTDEFPSPTSPPSVYDEWMEGQKKGQSDGDRADEWYDLPAEQQWELSLRHLRTHAGPVDLHPDTFMTRHFGSDAMTVFGLEAWLDEQVPVS